MMTPKIDMLAAIMVARGPFSLNPFNSRKYLMRDTADKFITSKTIDPVSTINADSNSIFKKSLITCISSFLNHK